MMGDPGNAPLLSELRRALHHLYDPAELRRSTLPALLGLEQGEDPAASLRRALVEAIEALKPGPGVPAQSNAWRLYHLLFQRYTEQFTQREVATDLGLSIRQLRRQETIALRLLADHLAARYGLHAPASPQAAKRLPDEDTPSREQELDWLRRSLPSEPVDLETVCRAVLTTVAPLAQAQQVSVECRIPAGLPRLAVQVTSMRQALLNLLMAAIRSAPGGQVQLEAEPARPRVHVHIRPRQPRAAAPGPDEHAESVEMARQLLELSGGSVELLPGEGARQPFRVRLNLPAAEQVAVLIIDDNADTLQLLARYLAGSHYRFIGASDPEQALALAEQASPQIIVLDVMLPGVDGWELLGRLREHPRTRGLPVIVCTILPQEPLALGLGAAAFLRKPVSRRLFLSALDRLVEQRPRGCG